MLFQTGHESINHEKGEGGRGENIIGVKRQKMT